MLVSTETSTFLQPWAKTSLVEVTNTLPYKPPCRVFFKNEYEQPSGSFKLRGIGNLVGKSVEEARRQGKDNIQVLASSGGNAGLAAAYASRFYGVPCTVVLPRISKPEVLAKLQEYNAETVVYGKNINEADYYLKNTVMEVYKEKHIIYCHPFDNPLIWEGHSSIIDEISNQLSGSELQKMKSVVCSVGGGGLYNGIVDGLKKNKIDKATSMLLIETNQAPTMTESVNAGQVITLKSVSSLATSLACSYLSPKSLENYVDPNGYKSYIETIDDLETIKALIQFYTQTGIVVEPACGAALSVVYNQIQLLEKNFPLKEDDIIVVVVCGGSCTSIEGLQDFKTLVRRQTQKL